MRLSRRASLALGGAFLVAPSALRAQEPPLLRVGLNTNEATVQAYYAEKAGIFKKNGLNVELDQMAGGAAVAAAMVGGSLQIGASNVISFAAEVLRGLPFVAIAPGAISDASRQMSGIVVSANSPIRTARDLNGKVVSGVSIGGIDHLAALVWIDANGGDAKSVNVIELPPSAVPDALGAGRIAASMVTEPFLSADRASGLRVLGDAYDAIGPHFMATLWIATTSWASANAPTARAFSASVVQGTQWSLANSDRAVELLGEWTRMKVDRLRQPMATTLDPALLQPLLDAAVKYRFLPRPVTAADLVWRG